MSAKVDRWPTRASPINTWQEAEVNAAKWMKAWGFPKAKVTPAGPDAGVDVRGSGAIAQVKFRVVKAGRRDMQLLVGSSNRTAPEVMLFFSRSGFATTAVAYAELWRIALFSYDETGAPFPENKSACSLCGQAGYRPQRSTSLAEADVSTKRSALLAAAVVKPLTAPAKRIPPSAKVKSTNLTSAVANATAVGRTDVPRTQRGLVPEVLQTSGGKQVIDQVSALEAVKAWAGRSGYSGARLARGGHVQADGFIAFVRYSGPLIGEDALLVVLASPANSMKVAISFVGFEKATLKGERVALFTCNRQGQLAAANKSAEIAAKRTR